MSWCSLCARSTPRSPGAANSFFCGLGLNGIDASHELPHRPQLTYLNTGLMKYDAAFVTTFEIM